MDNASGCPAPISFLPFVEQGLITFIGATTENPSFEVNGALLSRAAVYVLQPLTAADLAELVTRGASKSLFLFTLSDSARDSLVAYADGDARRLLNMVDRHGR